MRILYEPLLDFQDVLIQPKRSTLSSRADVLLERDMTMLYSKASYSGFPVLAANMDSVGTFEMAKAMSALHMSVALHKHYPVDELSSFFSGWASDASPLFYSMGISEADWAKFEQVDALCSLKWICLDVANGYQEHFVRFLSRLRERKPDATIMAGNVVTGEMTEHLILAGADIVKVGIGPGSVCTTRWISGVGRPQLSAVIECADAAHGLGGHVCSDGGCASPGDVAKAFGAGADFVMLGGMLAGHDECAGERVERDGKTFLKFHGMSSREAMEQHYGGVASHRAPEGKEVLVPYKGGVEKTLLEIAGGVRSACSYVGAKKLKEMPKRTTFVMVNRQLNESFGKPNAS